jgi:type I restriction enzyme S subunit
VSPPLPEQSRIVAKVDELMALCDRLEAEQGQAARVQGHWVEAALAQLADSADADDFARHWQHLAQHFDTLFTTPDSITQLEATLLQLAVRGKLVPQDPNDEPASALLQKIRTEKDRLIAEGKIKKDKPLPPISDEEKPFALPEGWEWIRAGEVFELLNGYAFKSDQFKPVGIRLARNINIAHGEMNWEQPAFIDESRLHEFNRFELSDGDLLLSLDRPIISTGLKYALIKQSDLPCLLLQRVAKIKPWANSVLTGFTVVWLNSNLFKANIDPGRSNGVPHISTQQVADISFPLPPRPEQSRIVTKLEALFALTAGLKAQLAKVQKTQASLADVLLETSI